MKEKLGWLKDYSDFRDYSPEHIGIKNTLKLTKGRGPLGSDPIPSKIDLSEWCSPVEDQYNLGSCTANAGVGLLEYFEQRTADTYLNASRLFLYKTTRNLMQLTGDTGTYLRTTMKSMVLFGIPPEKYWPYDIQRFDQEPTPFCYSFGQSYKAIEYFRLDPFHLTAKNTLDQIRKFISKGFPSMFGFSVYQSITQAKINGGEIPYPSAHEAQEGGHAVVAVGYDDSKKIQNEIDHKTTTGAFKIRNSWGEDWGDKGYGWLPYDYVLKNGLATDWWTLLKAEYIVDTGIFD